MFLVTGATGRTGSAVVQRLLDRGHPVRVYVRSPDRADSFTSRGAQVAVGDLHDEEALTRACDGVDGASLMLPYTPDSADFVGEGRELVGTFRRAVDAAQVPRTVGLSSIGAHLDPPVGPMTRESIFESAFADHRDARFVRAAYFVENWTDVLDATAGGILPTFLRPDLVVSMVSTVDIGATAADLLVDDEPRRIVELAGPVDVSANDVASTLAAALGRPVSAAPAPLDQVAAAFRGFGFSPHIADLVHEMYVAYDDGTLTFEGEPRRGSTPIETTLRAMLAARAAAPPG